MLLQRMRNFQSFYLASNTPVVHGDIFCDYPRDIHSKTGKKKKKPQTWPAITIHTSLTQVPFETRIATSWAASIDVITVIFVRAISTFL